MTDRQALRERFEELARCTEPGQYATVSGEDVRAVLELIRDAEPHLLTLEECRDPERIVVVEYKVLTLGPDYQLEEGTNNQKRAMYIGKGWNGDREWTYFVCFRKYMDQNQFPTDEYGTKWRCWSADPGDEVRKEMKWDE